jgi:hypothetical protein
MSKAHSIRDDDDEIVFQKAVDEHRCLITLRGAFQPTSHC